MHVTAMSAEFIGFITPTPINHTSTIISNSIHDRCICCEGMKRRSTSTSTYELLRLLLSGVRLGCNDIFLMNWELTGMKITSSS